MHDSLSHMTNIFPAVNCTEVPIIAQENDRGMFDWTLESRNAVNFESLPMEYGTTIRYW